MNPEIPSERSIFLWPNQPPHSAPSDTFRPWLDPYLVKGNRLRGAVLICPGGGYTGRAAHEGIAIAQRFNQDGLHAFVVHYRVSPNRHPAPLLDVSRAMRMIRQRAVEWLVSTDHIAVCGFSAGGHLTASLGVHFDTEFTRAGDPIEKISSRPDALILCYPVITSGPHSHRGSFNQLLGENPSPELMEKMSLERQVTSKTPPSFLWHTAEDKGVRVENSLLFAQALSQNKVPFELHVYPAGRHGLGLALEDPHVATWMPLCCEWLRGMDW
ncbi:MAG: alpha/beta hydrolase [Verrucomicrobiae bacterium]|nr:alpha/beta hydrolase [Verrucomicrobiae bacterium]